MKNLSQIVLAPVLVLPALVAVGCAGADPSEQGSPAGAAGIGGAGQAGALVQAAGAAHGGSVGTGGAGSSGQASAGISGLAPGGADSGGSNTAAGSSGAASTQAGMAGVSSSAGQGGIGGGGNVDALDVAKGLDGLRVDDPCTGTPDTSNGAVCNHVVLTDGGFKSAKDVTIGGTPGTTYDVTLRIRGVVEPTQIDGGTRTDTTTFKYQNMTWRKVPFTIGGTVNRGDYSQWRITVASPKQEYFLNDYQTVGHYIFALDYQVTIQIAANSKVTLDGTDSNEREIVNYEKYAIDGIPGSMNYGQFVQCNVVSLKPH